MDIMCSANVSRNGEWASGVRHCEVDTGGGWGARGGRVVTDGQGIRVI